MKRNHPKKRQIKGTWHDRLLYYREDNYRGYLVLMFISINFLVLLVAILAFGLLGDTTGLSHKDIIWRGISIMLDPGNLEPDPSLTITIILSLITIVAMISFSSGMVAFLSNLLNDHLEDVRDGDKEIHYKHFTLFLGWNDRSLELLKAFMMKDSQNSVTDFVVILSKYNSRELRERIQKQLREYMKFHEGAHELRILVRNGDPAEYSSLLIVDYMNADEVFIFKDDDVNEPDYEVERTFFSLMHAYGTQERDAGKDISDNWVDIMVEAITEETSEMINRFQPRRKGGRSFRAEAFSSARLLGEKYAEIVSGQEQVIICNMNLTVPYMLEELKKRTEAGKQRLPRVLLLAEKEQEQEMAELYEDSRFEGMWMQPPVVFRGETEMARNLVTGLKNGCRGIFIMSDYMRALTGVDHRNFGLWVSMMDMIESEDELIKSAESAVFFEMLDETDAQIMEGFDFGRCIITANLISEHMIELCRSNGVLPE